MSTASGPGRHTGSERRPRHEGRTRPPRSRIFRDAPGPYTRRRAAWGLRRASPDVAPRTPLHRANHRRWDRVRGTGCWRYEMVSRSKRAAGGGSRSASMPSRKSYETASAGFIVRNTPANSGALDDHAILRARITTRSSSPASVVPIQVSCSALGRPRWATTDPEDPRRRSNRRPKHASTPAMCAECGGLLEYRPRRRRSRPEAIAPSRQHAESSPARSPEGDRRPERTSRALEDTRSAARTHHRRPPLAAHAPLAVM